MALASASASASAAVARCGSPRLASLASSPRSPSTRIASFSLASPRLARVASLASPHSPSHRLASVRLARLTLASPCLARLTSSLALASHRLLPSPRLASLASPPRSPFSLAVPAPSPRPPRRLPPAASLPPTCRLQNLAPRTHATRRTAKPGFRAGRLLPV